MLKGYYVVKDNISNNAYFNWICNLSFKRNGNIWSCQGSYNDQIFISLGDYDISFFQETSIQVN